MTQLAIHPEIDYSSPEFQAAYDQNVGNRRWRMDNLYRIVNEKGIEVPFKMRLAQKILYLGLWYFNIVLKTRQPGITTFVCILFLDDCLFNPNTHAIFISYNKDEMKETFQNKIRFPYESLPQYMKDANPATKDTETGLRFTNGSSIRVTMSGRGGTYQRVHISEFGKICAKYPDKAREIKTGTLNAVHPGQRVIIESTAAGKEGSFYSLCKQAQDLEQMSKELTKMDPKFFFFPWFRNELDVLDEPAVIFDYQEKYFKQLQAKLGIRLANRQKYWYVSKWNIQGDDMKQEHPATPEEAFEVAIQGTYYIDAFKRIRKEGRIAKVPFHEGTLVNTWWDIGFGDDTAIWFTQDVGREIHVINYYENSGYGFKHYADILDEKKKKHGYRYAPLMLPWDAVQHDRGTGDNYQTVARKQGFKSNLSPKTSLEYGIEQTRQILTLCHFDEEKSETGLNKLENYRKAWNEKLACYRDIPLKDKNIHGADAFRTMAVSHRFAPAYEKIDTEAQKRAKEKADPRGWT